MNMRFYRIIEWMAIGRNNGAISVEAQSCPRGLDENLLFGISNNLIFGAPAQARTRQPQTSKALGPGLRRDDEDGVARGVEERRIKADGGEMLRLTSVIGVRVRLILLSPWPDAVWTLKSRLDV
jgi:hypothetical protein